MAMEQLDLFNFEKKVKKKAAKKASEPKKEPVRRRLKSGEVAYQCMECDKKPIISPKLILMLKCEKCGFYMEVVDEKIPMIGENKK